MFSRSLLICGMLAAVCAPLRAQWYSDSTRNTPVCTLAGSQHTMPAMCSDGANGAIIAWQDTRNGGTTNIYAQRLDYSGHPVWTMNGVRLAAPSTNAAQTNPIVASDGNGGAYVVWQDARNSSTSNGIDLYGQHIMADGSLAGGAAGFAVSTGTRNQINAAICSDGRGGAFVAWEDYRDPKSQRQPDIYFNRLSGGGASFGNSGTIADTGGGGQRRPAICDDGNGGCYIAWEDGSVLPIAVRANHFSSGGNAYWGLHGFQVFQENCGSCYTANATHISMRRDGQEVMLAWEVTSVTGFGQDIMATRIRAADPFDSTMVWGQAINVTGDMLYDQTWPQIFSDDSAIEGLPDDRGILVPFENQKPGSTDNAISMVRVPGTGNQPRPGGGTAYDIVRQSNGQVGFQAAAFDTTVLAVWNDARFGATGGPDTCIYAQRIDKSGNRFWPTYRTKSTWGVPVCNTGKTAKQVAIVPRTDGIIAAWTDYRNGVSNAAIYAQLLLLDGSRSADHAAPLSTVESRTGSFDGSDCNSHCTNMLATDTGVDRSGIDSIRAIAMANLQLTASFQSGSDSVAYSVCVLDTMKTGVGTVEMKDIAGNASTADFYYCPLPDSLSPVITWDSTSNWLDLHVRDNRPWDRGLQSITILDSSNVSLFPSLTLLNPGAKSFDLLIAPVDPTQPSTFCIEAADTAGNTTSQYCFTRSLSTVLEVTSVPFSISIVPGIVTENATFELQGADRADVTVLDLLGRTVDRFSVTGLYEWEAGSLPPGMYLVRATYGNRESIARFVRE